MRKTIEDGTKSIQTEFWSDYQKKKIFSSISVFKLFLYKYFFLLADHKVDFIAPFAANKSIFWPSSK